jgi:hypothetical protein
MSASFTSYIVRIIYIVILYYIIRRLRLAEHVARMEERTGAYRVLVCNLWRDYLEDP